MKSKFKYLLFATFLLIMPVCNLLAAATPSYDYRGKEMNVVYIIAVVLMAIRIIVPIVLIVTGMAGLIKAMISSDEREVKIELKKLIPKVIFAIIIFILPAAIAMLMRMMNLNSTWTSYSSCIAKPSSCKVQLWK